MSRRAWSAAGVLAVLLGGVVVPTLAESPRPIAVSAGPGAMAGAVPSGSTPAVRDVAERRNATVPEGPDRTGNPYGGAGHDGRVELARRSWTSIVRWLEAHAPASAAALHGPVDEAALTAAEEETGREWPEQLVAWLRMNDGEGRSGDAEIVPLGYLPLGVDWILRNWRMMVEISEEVNGPEEMAAGEAQPAGSRSGAYLRSWLPIGDDTSGDLLFVDTRPGTQSGSVSDFEHDNGGFTRPPVWPDIAAMLEDVAAALRSGRWVHPHDPDYDMVPVVRDGKLHWDFGPSSQRKLAETKRRMEEEDRRRGP
jgi:cell wall assembly regulator SMI1